MAFNSPSLFFSLLSTLSSTHFPCSCDARSSGRPGERNSNVVAFRTGLLAGILLCLSANALFSADEKADEEAADDLPVYTGEEIVVTESKEKVATIGSVASKIPVPLSETPASVSGGQPRADRASERRGPWRRGFET